jgi:hypothetical protein
METERRTSHGLNKAQLFVSKETNFQLPISGDPQAIAASTEVAEKCEPEGGGEARTWTSR